MSQCYLLSQIQRKPPHPSPATLNPSSSSLSSSTTIRPAILATLPDDCLAHVLSFLPRYYVCSFLLTTCWEWNVIVCRNFGHDYIKKWGDPKNVRLGGGLLILRPVCAAVSLIWSMEKCGMSVDTEERVKLLCVRYETAWSMNMDKLAETDAKAIIKIAPKMAVGHLYLGDLYARRGNHDKARKAYTQAIKVEPGNEQVLHKINDLSVQTRVSNLADWMARMSTIKRVVILTVILIFIILFITQALRVF